MSFLGLFDPPIQKNRTYQGTQFEIFVEQLFRHYYSGIMRNTVFEVHDGKNKQYSTQIDICCRLGRFYNLKDKYGLFELKFSNEFTINEDAIAQLLRSCNTLEALQSKIHVEPVAVVTNKDFTKGACGLAEKHSVKLINGEDLWEMYTKAHKIRAVFDPDPSIDDKIRKINVHSYRTAPNYVHIRM
jgi:hypothetical protein